MKEQFFSTEIPLEERAQILEDTCDKVIKNYPYVRRLTEEELDGKAHQLADVSIQIEEIDERKKEFLAEIKEERDPLSRESKELIRALKNKVEESTDTVYLIKGDDRAYIYAPDGTLIEDRRLRPDERQTTIMRPLRDGTND